MAISTVHFATNREEQFAADGTTVVGFSGHLNTKSPVWLRFGAADMTAPATPSSLYGIAELRVAPEQIPGVTTGRGGQVQLGSDTVFDGLRRRLIDDRADLLLILHGYGCDFANALSNAAELKAKWSGRAKPLDTAIFSWPSEGTLVPYISYVSDRDAARSSAKAVARALQRFLFYIQQLKREDWCNANIHLVAHSMGNYVLRNALQAMLSDFGGKPLPRVFKNIFLMAADEDNDAFEDPDKLARLPELAEAVQVYFSRVDGALTISDVTKGNPDRLGATGPRTLTSLPQKVTLVDCTDVSDTGSVTDARHQYYRKRAEVLADVRQVIAGAAPEAVTGRKWIPSRNCFWIKPSKP